MNEDEAKEWNDDENGMTMVLECSWDGTRNLENIVLEVAAHDSCSICEQGSDHFPYGHRMTAWNVKKMIESWQGDGNLSSDGSYIFATNYTGERCCEDDGTHDDDDSSDQQHHVSVEWSFRFPSEELRRYFENDYNGF